MQGSLTSETAGEAPEQTLRSLVARVHMGATVGALYGLGLTYDAQDGLASLSLDSQASYLALAVLGNALFGAGLVLAIACLGPLTRRWFGERPFHAAWLAVMGIALLELQAALDLDAWAHTLVLLACAWAGLAWATRPPRLLRDERAAWGLPALGLVFAAALGWKIAASSPLAHGAALWSCALLPLLAVWFGSSLALAKGLRKFGAAAILVAVAFGLFLAWPRTTESSMPDTKVIVISVDTLRADHLGCYGSATVRTPNIDAFAAESTLFEEAVSPIPTTNPAHSSLLTGLEPGNHGVINNAPYAFADDVRTLPDLLSPLGVKTAAFVSGYTLKRNLSRMHGRFELFDDIFGFLPLVPSEWRDTALPRVAKELGPYLGLQLRTLDERFDRTAEDLVDSAMGWLDRNQESPYFLFLHLYDPHMPYDPPADFAAMYGVEPHSQNWYRTGPDERSEIVADKKRAERLRALYRGEISYVDSQLGRLFDYLDESGFDGWLVLTSDHGESLGEHDYWFDHSYFLYDTCLRIPLIVRGPGVEAGKRITTPARLIDLFPTLMDALELEHDAVDGTSLMPLFSGEELTAQPAFSVTYDFRETHKKRVLSVRTQRWKYVRTSIQWDEYFQRKEREELYDLVADPDELEDLSEMEPGELQRFRQLSSEPWTRWTHEAGGLAGEVSEEDRQTLEDLGYTGG